MKLVNDPRNIDILQEILDSYYSRFSGRSYFIFEKENGNYDGWMYLNVLLDRKWVIRYGVGNDPHPSADRWVGGVELAIGPFFFGPAQFWSPANSSRFNYSINVDSIIYNLELMDEFLGGGRGFPDL